MPSKPTATRSFVEPYTSESSIPLPSNDDDVLAALDGYGAKYNKGPSKQRKADREEVLAGLSWLHLNHDNIAPALRRISQAQQPLLASALSLDFEAHGGQARWPASLGRAICVLTSAITRLMAFSA